MDIRKILIDSIRLYFAPLWGAYKAVKEELARIEQGYKSS